jgi:hypothetical protein
MSIRKQFFTPGLLLPVVITICLLSSSSSGRDVSASIQATAHVEGSLGLVDAVVERDDPNYNIVPGSHLYWLYYPRQDGVLLQLSHPSRTGESGLKPVSSEVVRLVPDILRQYPQVSLVDLSGTAAVAGGDTALMVLTVIFTNN